MITQYCNNNSNSNLIIIGIKTSYQYLSVFRMYTFHLFVISAILVVLILDSCHSVNGLAFPPVQSEIFSRKSFISISIATAASSTLYQLSAEADVGDDYVTTPRGLKYKVVKPPNDLDSPSPKRAQKVKASYTLYLNGFPEDTSSSTKIDSSKSFLGEKPFEFLAGVSQVIKGWDLAIMDMKVGEARKLVIDSDLGYGAKGAGGKIPGGATLYFDVELIEIGAESKLGPEQYKWLDDNPL